MNKTNKLQKILMTACLCVLFFFAATVVLRFFTRQVLVLKLQNRCFGSFEAT